VLRLSEGLGRARGKENLALVPQMMYFMADGATEQVEVKAPIDLISLSLGASIVGAEPMVPAFSEILERHLLGREFEHHSCIGRLCLWLSSVRTQRSSLSALKRFLVYVRRWLFLMFCLLHLRCR
jgi:hypothetical protein